MTLILQGCLILTWNSYNHIQTPSIAPWAKCAILMSVLSEVYEAHLLSTVVLKKKLCFLWFLCAVEPEQQPLKEKQPSLGIWGEGKQKCLISLKLWLCSNSSHSLLFLSFPLHLYDSQQKIDSGREWIVGDAEAFLSWMCFSPARCQNQTAVRPWSSGFQREKLIAVGLIHSFFLSPHTTLQWR